MDDPVVGLDLLGFVPRHDGARLDLQFRHRLAQGCNFSPSGLRVSKGFAHLYQSRGLIALGHDEVNLFASFRPVVMDLRVEPPLNLASGGYVLRYLHRASSRLPLPIIPTRPSSLHEQSHGKKGDIQLFCVRPRGSGSLQI